jgi:pyruvate formate lyase activating enzyme
MTDLQPTPIETLEHAVEIGKKAGLKFIYAGNIPGHDSENTYCYSCGKSVIRRHGYQTMATGLKGIKCSYCGAELNIRAGKGVE